MKRSTLISHAGHGAPEPSGAVKPHVPPIYQSATYSYPDAATAEAAALGREYLYMRDRSATDDALAHTFAQLEGAEGTLVFASGMGAIAAAVEAYVGAGGHLVGVEGLYGGSHELITKVLPRFGVSHTFVAAARPAEIETAIKSDTQCVYVESISNPLLRVADVEGIAKVCRGKNVPLLVDATFATPLMQRPIELGATLSIHSGTKYVNGHGDVLLGLVSGAAAALARVRTMRKFHGASADPFASWMALRGLKTMAVRVERQVATAGKIARGLKSVKGVVRLHYPGLEEHPDFELAKRALDAPGAMVCFEVDGIQAARRVYDRLKVVARAASLGEVSSLMTHPAKFSHVGLSDDERRRYGIADGLLRLSVGLEDPDDLLADLKQAIEPA